MAAALQYPLPTSPVQAQPIVLVDASGNPISSSNGQFVTVTNATSLGQQLTINSTSIVPASDSPAFPTKNPGWTMIYSTTQTGVSSWSGSGDLTVGQYSQILINIQLSAITGTSIQFITKRKDSFNNYYAIDSPAAMTAPGGANRSIGPGVTANAFFGAIAQLVVTLVSITSVTFTVDMWAR
jgi:hypothetical protein